MEQEEVQGLWISGLPSEEMERDIEAWRKAEKVLGDLSNAFMHVPGEDVPFVVLLDAKVRIRRHIKSLQEEGQPPKPEESNETPDVLTAVNGLLSEAADLLTEPHAPTEEGYEVEREILQHIARAGKTVASEQQRRHGKALLCSAPGCRRPMIVRDGFPGCKEHREHFDAVAEVEAREYTREVLGPWVEAVRAVGHPELTGVMEEALGQVDENLARARRELERTRAALSATEEAKDA